VISLFVVVDVDAVFPITPRHARYSYILFTRDIVFSDQEPAYRIVRFPVIRGYVGYSSAAHVDDDNDILDNSVPAFTVFEM